MSHSWGWRCTQTRTKSSRFNWSSNWSSCWFFIFHC